MREQSQRPLLTCVRLPQLTASTDLNCRAPGTASSRGRRTSISLTRSPSVIFQPAAPSCMRCSLFEPRWRSFLPGILTAQLLEQRLGIFQIGGVEALCEPVVVFGDHRALRRGGPLISSDRATPVVARRAMQLQALASSDSDSPE